MFNALVKIANHLDRLGHYEAAGIIDQIIKSASVMTARSNLFSALKNDDRDAAMNALTQLIGVSSNPAADLGLDTEGYKDVTNYIRLGDLPGARDELGIGMNVEIEDDPEKINPFTGQPWTTKTQPQPSAQGLWVGREKISTDEDMEQLAKILKDIASVAGNWKDAQFGGVDVDLNAGYVDFIAQLPTRRDAGMFKDMLLLKKAFKSDSKTHNFIYKMYGSGLVLVEEPNGVEVKMAVQSDFNTEDVPYTAKPELELIREMVLRYVLGI